MDQDINKLAAGIAKLNGHRFMKMHNSVPKILAFNFARGLAFGLGSVIGATLLVSVLVYLRSQIDFISLIGEWATVPSTALADINGAIDENANDQ